MNNKNNRQTKEEEEGCLFNVLVRVMAHVVLVQCMWKRQTFRSLLLPPEWLVGTN